MADAITDNGQEGGERNGDGGSQRPSRLPRWTREEIMVLIQGKKLAETRRRGREADQMGTSGEPKWVGVSAYCRRRGVDRGPLQCRKRWGNLVGDYRKIKGWERRRGAGDGEGSFWAMRGDLRRERKLPASFDREVYYVLDGAREAEPEEGEDEVEEEPPPAAVEEEAVFDSGRTAAEDGLFSDLEEEQYGEGGEEKEGEEEWPTAAPAFVNPVPGMTNGRQPVESTERGSSSHEAQKKRKRPSLGDVEENYLQSQLMEGLQQNSKVLLAHLEAQSINQQLERDQRKAQVESLVGALNKLTDALDRIADKLP